MTIVILSLVNLNTRKRLDWMLRKCVACFLSKKKVGRDSHHFFLQYVSKDTVGYRKHCISRKLKHSVASDCTPHCFLTESVCFPVLAKRGMSIKKNDCSRVGSCIKRGASCFAFPAIRNPITSPKYHILPAAWPAQHVVVASQIKGTIAKQARAS